MAGVVAASLHERMNRMSSTSRRGFLALGSLAGGTLAAPALLRAQSLTNIADTLAGDTRFTRFLDVITRASMVPDFRQPGPMTVFAPVDQAFMGAPAGLMQDLMTGGQGGGAGGDSSGDSSGRLRWMALINYHIVPGAFRLAELAGADRRLRTKNGADLQFSGSAGAMTIRNPAPAQQMAGFGAFGANFNARPAQIIGAETVASNGVIYPISELLFP
jgi:uncharacterized surface protein with fasciclin (FAS1) repeats